MTVAEGISIGLGFLAIVAPDFWPKMPRPISYIIAGIGFSWLAYSGILALQDVTAMKIQNGPLVTIILGAIVAEAGIFWHIYLSKKPDEAMPIVIPAAPSNGVSQTAETARRTALLDKLRQEYILSHDGISPAMAAGLEHAPAEWTNERLRQLGEQWQVQPPAVDNHPKATAYFDCSIGRWLEAENSGKDAFNISVMKFGMVEPTVALSSGPISKENHNKQFSSSAPLKCEITFHGASPIFNIEIPFAVDIYETIWGNNRNSSGNHIKTINMPFSVKQVIIPNTNVFTVYVYSFDVDAYIGVRTPEKFTFVANEGRNRYEGKFIAPNSPSMLVGPNPTPLEQNTSAGPK